MDIRFEIRGEELIYTGRHPETVEDAHKISIRKWETIVAYLEEGQSDYIQDNGPYTCGFCMLFWFGDDECRECPVYERTGRLVCSGTPYDAWLYRTRRFSDGDNLTIAKEELEFLKSLEV
jgi:hypothetical protein